MVKRLPIEEMAVASDIKSEKVNLKLKVLNKKYKQALREIRANQTILEAVTCSDITPRELNIRADNGKNESTAFLDLSDWHVDEIVRSNSVNGKNKFNAKVADKRINNLFANALKLIKIGQAENSIKDVVIVLGGDFFSGNIHEELLENTSMLPIEAVMFAQDHLVSGIKFLNDHLKVKFHVVCVVGNHSRITQKVHNSSEYGNSLEYYMYHNIAKFFAKHKNIRFTIPQGYHQYIKVYGKTIRIHHGHNMRYGGGVGGVFIPVNKAINEWNKIRYADLDIIHHFHRVVDGGNFTINGSLIGFNAYALSIKASPEPPKQLFFLWHKKYGKIMTTPIFLDN